MSEDYDQFDLDNAVPMLDANRIEYMVVKGACLPELAGLKAGQWKTLALMLWRCLLEMRKRGQTQTVSLRRQLKTAEEKLAWHRTRTKGKQKK